jgi:hypothetical protein
VTPARTTAADVEAAERSLEYASSCVVRAAQALQARREAVRSGQPQEDAARLRAALADAALVAAAEACDAAAARLVTAEGEHRRCQSRHGRHGETPLAAERRQALNLARGRAEAALRALLPLLEPHGLADPTPGRCVAGLRGLLSCAEELSDEGALPTELARAEDAHAQARLHLEDVRARRWLPAEVEAAARALTPDARALLARLVGGYSPQPATIAKAPLYAVLAAAELARGGSRSAAPTAWGAEVARWAAENLTERVAFDRALAPVEWSRGHDREEREAMRDRVDAALGGDLGDGLPIEVGDPTAGYSYRLASRREVLTWFRASLRLRERA